MKSTRAPLPFFLLYIGNSGSGKLEIGLNLDVQDGHDETPLSLSLWTKQFSIAQQLLKAGADIECVDREEPGLLYVTILRERATAAMFLLENGAEYKKRYKDIFVTKDATD